MAYDKEYEKRAKAIRLLHEGVRFEDVLREVQRGEEKKREKR